MSIAVFGSVNIDLTTYSAELPRPGETLHGDRYAIGPGGKGCNQAVAAARLGSEVAFVGRVGAIPSENSHERNCARPAYLTISS